MEDVVYRSVVEEEEEAVSSLSRREGAVVVVVEEVERLDRYRACFKRTLLEAATSDWRLTRAQVCRVDGCLKA